MDYTKLTAEEINELYAYYLKTLINKMHAYKNVNRIKKSEIRMEVQQICIKLNKLRKFQGKASINVLKIHIGDVSFYLEFF